MVPTLLALRPMLMFQQLPSATVIYPFCTQGWTPERAQEEHIVDGGAEYPTSEMLVPELTQVSSQLLH
jgi:hypothetical protein